MVAHCFASMLVPLGFARAPAATPGSSACRDAYLEPFGDLAPHAELVETLELACRAGKIARALTWDRALSSLPPDEPGEHADATVHRDGVAAGRVIPRPGLSAYAKRYSQCRQRRACSGRVDPQDGQGRVGGRYMSAAIAHSRRPPTKTLK